MKQHIRRQCYKVRYHDGTAARMGLDELAQLVEDGMAFEDVKSVRPDSVSLGCSECNWDYTCGVSEAHGWFGTGCPDCASADVGVHGQVGLQGSYSHEMVRYFTLKKRDPECFRPNRPDYWNLIIHFTSRERFVSIMDKGTIKAEDTGCFRVPAVCLTDVPLLFADEMLARYGPYGIAFAKSALKRQGGGPALYMSDELIDAQKRIGFADEVKPFVNVVRVPSTAPAAKRKKRVDYLHDREWRFPDELDLDTVRPVGVVIDHDSIWGKNWQVILDAAYEFGVITSEEAREFHSASLIDDSLAGKRCRGSVMGVCPNLPYGKPDD